MDPLTIGLLCALGGALFSGSVVYAVQESDKQEIITQVQELERSHAGLERKLKEAQEREVKNRYERLRLLMRFYAERLKNLSHEEEIALPRLARLWASVEQLQVVEKLVRKDGTLPPEHQ